jgi:hypothetical protein
MRVLASAVVVLAALALAGCEGEKKGVEVHTPNVDVKAGPDGATVTTPKTDVDVEKK